MHGARVILIQLLAVRRHFIPVAALAVACLPASVAAQTQGTELQTAFRVKYVGEGSLYLEGGSAAGLAPGQHLSVMRKRESGATEKAAAELVVISVATTSAVCEILNATEEIRPGDVAVLSPGDVARLELLRKEKESRKYPQVVSFTDGDPLSDEVRADIPRPPSPEVNRIRGRVGVEYLATCDLNASGSSSRQIGGVIRMEMTRIGGTFWNFGGYYRGRLDYRRRGTAPETLTELLNRTYHLSLTYNNPGSRWVAGFGRLYLPWASSLSTIDGGYLGRRVGRNATFAVFGGSAPDPTSWSYDPNRELAGALANFETGRFDSLRYTGTFGVALTRVHWHPDRQYGFLENGLFYKRYLSVYQSLEADLLRPATGAGQNGLALSRSYLTVRVQPARYLVLDVNHNYFRTVPTFDARLISTGLVDKLLFQGLSWGARVDLPYRLGLYSSLGRSSRTGDERASWNQMYGVSMSGIWRTGIRADFRYSVFDSSFGTGSYRALILSRDIGEGFRFNLQVGTQNISSAFTAGSRARWGGVDLDWLLFVHYFLGSGFMAYRGDVQSYNQWYVNLGYRF